MSESLTHAQAELLLPQYQQGSLGREQVRALHGHFKDCEACRTRIRLQRALAHDPLKEIARDMSSPEIQKQMARNRDLLVKILLLLLFGFLVFRYKR